MRLFSKATVSQRNRLRMASIFLAFTVLVGLFFVPCYLYIRQVTRNNVLESHQRRLEMGMSTFHISVNALSKLDELVFENVAYRSLKYPDNQIDSQQLDGVRRLITDYLIPYDMIAEAGIVKENDIILTRQFLFYQRNGLLYQDYFLPEKSDFLQHFKGAQLVIPAMNFNTVSYGSYNAFTVAFRWASASRIYVFANYPVSRLTALLADAEALKSGGIALYAGDTLVLEVGQRPENAEMLTASGDNSLRLRAELRLSDDYIEQDLQSLHHLVAGFAAVFGLALVVWIVLFACMMARPFDRISEALQNSSHLENAPATTMDMVESIQLLDRKITDYSHLLVEREERIREQMLEKAVYRGLYSTESREDFHKVFPYFPENWQMLLLQWAADSTEVAEEMLQMLFLQTAAQAMPDETLITVNRSTLLVVLDAQTAPVHKAETLKQLLETQGISSSYTLSRVYNDPAMLADAFQQLEYDSIVLQQKPSSVIRARKAPITMQQLHTLFLALQCGDADAALAAFRNGTAAVDSGDFFIAQYSYRMIANTLVHIKLESECELNDIPIPAFSSDQWQSLFEEEFPDCIRKIADRMAQQRSVQSESLEEEILAYIDENIANKQLCLTMVTDHFRISAPTLQKRLNTCVGKTFSAYVELVRINRARQLLQETGMTVSEIADAVGYTNANSFYKAYKRCFGVAPRSERSSR